jgi:hypothetical protein
MPNGVPALESAQYIVSRSIGKESWQGTAGRRQQRSALIELRVLSLPALSSSNGSKGLLLTTILTLPFPTKIVVF